MERFILELKNLIGEQFLLDNVTVDEDYGQLEAIAQGLDQYPVTFPCVLISDIVADFKDLCELPQRGKMTFVIRLAMDCYDDTHYGSGQEEAIEHRMLANTVLTKLINGRRIANTPGKTYRVQFRSYSMPHGVKVYETTYQCSITD